MSRKKIKDKIIIPSRKPGETFFEELGISPERFSDYIVRSNSAMGYNRGNIAEIFFMDEVIKDPRVLSITKLCDSGKGDRCDFEVVMKSGDRFLIELKSILTDSVSIIRETKKMVGNVPITNHRNRKITVGNKILKPKVFTTSLLGRKKFPMLAICCQTFLGRNNWVYAFILSEDIPKNTSSWSIKPSEYLQFFHPNRIIIEYPIILPCRNSFSKAYDEYIFRKKNSPQEDDAEIYIEEELDEEQEEQEQLTLPGIGVDKNIHTNKIITINKPIFSEVKKYSEIQSTPKRKIII